jgi:site-specific recombinase XerD
LNHPKRVGLPDTLSIEEIDALIKAIDLTSNEGERNRAMLETLMAAVFGFQN